MPKKRTSRYTKPSSSAHPSLSSGYKTTNKLRGGSSPEANSVNARIRQLRLQQNNTRSKIYEAPPSHTVHPSLQDIFHVPNAPSPRPRPGLRVTGVRRGPAGPPPPGSWLERRPTQRNEYETAEKNSRQSPALPGYNLPRPGSLLDSTLKQLARHWEFHVQYDQYHLATIPVRYKELLLHYIALLEPCAIDRTGLETLFLDETDLEGATGAVDLLRLDLSTSIGRSLTLKDLKTFFTSPSKSMATAAKAGAVTNLALPSTSLPESWDTEPPPHRPLYFAPCFATLTHLSLSSPPRSISWSYLLHHLLPNFPSQSLTHLSLAFWPFPTLTPNSLTATSASPAGPIQAGGSTFYSSYDSDWAEPASILRRVARATLALQWLDLTGDWPWMQALADDGFDWSGGGLWAGLETLVVGQGWVPECFAPPSSHRTAGDDGNDGLFPKQHNDGAYSKNDDSSNNCPPTSVWRHQHPFISILSSTFDTVEAYETMRLTQQGRAFLKWAHTEHACLAFEQAIRAKLNRAPTVLPGVEADREENGTWTLSTVSSAGASRRLERKEDHIHMTPRRIKGIQFERGWSGDWVSEAVKEIAGREADILEGRIRVRIE